MLQGPRSGPWMPQWFPEGDATLYLALLNNQTETVTIYDRAVPLTAPTQDLGLVIDVLGPPTPDSEGIANACAAFFQHHQTLRHVG